jgi:hypothetical protein
MGAVCAAGQWGAWFSEARKLGAACVRSAAKAHKHSCVGHHNASVNPPPLHKGISLMFERILVAIDGGGSLCLGRCWWPT